MIRAIDRLPEPFMSAVRSSILAFAVLATALASFDADARRLGGGRGLGMQRSAPAQPAPPAATPAPNTPAAPAATPARPDPPMAAAPAPTPRRSWLGPIAGLAAGLGLAALMSHLGLGAEFGSLLLVALLVLGGVWLLRLLMRRALPAGHAPLPAGALPSAPEPMRGHASEPSFETPNALRAPAGIEPSFGAAVPAGFDADAFARTAKAIFVRLQEANDAGRVDELRAFTTPELHAALREDVDARRGNPQRTDVVRLDARVLDVATEGAQQVVSVRFHGLLREAADQPAEPFDEVWHFVRPREGGGEWAIAGIQPAAEVR
jgi:predicted lipid-binding transport protein (Tim44 family)